MAANTKQLKTPAKRLSFDSDALPPNKTPRTDSFDFNNSFDDQQSLGDFRCWTVEDVTRFLMSHGFSHDGDKSSSDVIDKFREHKITGWNLPLLTDDELMKMGILAAGDRFKILQELRVLFELEDNGKVFNDPIHGHFDLPELCVKIIDTPQFQRLRFLKQLGACYYVYPGAAHNRFEHSLGACHLAGELVRTLQRRQPELKITEADVLCVRIAGLCHDLGHGPFSHIFDGKFIPKVRPDAKWSHENASVHMFDYLVEDNDLVKEFELYGLYEQDRLFIKEQIAGPMSKDSREWPYKGRDKSKGFLYEIVANKRNGIDVDKWDYFARDCHHLGIKNNFDHLRVMKFVRVVEADGENQICLRDKEVGNMYDMFHTRNALHRRAYQHSVCQAIEHMITDALLKANDHILFAGKDGKMLKMSEAIDDMVAYLKMTDTVLQQILYSTEPELEPAREVVMTIQKRQIYKCVGQTRPLSKTRDTTRLQRMKNQEVAREISSSLTEAELKEALRMRKMSTDSTLPDPDSLLIHMVDLNYGMKGGGNPIDNIRFYSKKNPNVAVQVRRNEVSQMLPETFAEYWLRVYTKQTSPDQRLKAELCFAAWCKKNGLDYKEGDLRNLELTPFKKESQELEEDELKECTRNLMQ